MSEISDERLREFIDGRCYPECAPDCAMPHSLARALLASRAEVERLKFDLRMMTSWRDDCVRLIGDNAGLIARLEAALRVAQSYIQTLTHAHPDDEVVQGVKILMDAALTADAPPGSPE